MKRHETQAVLNNAGHKCSCDEPTVDGNEGDVTSQGSSQERFAHVSFSLSTPPGKNWRGRASEVN